VVKDGLLFLLTVGDPPIVVLQPMNMILPSSPIDLHVEKFIVRITLFDVSNSRALLLACAFNDREAHHLPFELCM
jgi:hypothetical protein